MVHGCMCAIHVGIFNRISTNTAGCSSGYWYCSRFCGNMYSLTAYYNNMQNVNGYVYKPNTTSKSEMLSNMYLGITYYDAPITAGIVVNDSNEEWPYTTTGHATVVRGIRSDNQLVQLADPGVKYWNSTLNSYFMVSSDELYKAVSYSSKCGYIY